MLFSLLKQYLELYITDTALKVSRSLYCFTTFISHGIMSTPLGGRHIIFAFSVVRHPPSGRLVSAHLKEKYLSYLYQIWYGGLLG